MAPYKHDMAMTITGGLSKSERQHVQQRVRAAMAAQVLIDGKHQGGRAPYGYVVVDAGPHPIRGRRRRAIGSGCWRSTSSLRE
jgi:hypothetical protein